MCKCNFLQLLLANCLCLVLLLIGFTNSMLIEKTKREIVGDDVVSISPVTHSTPINPIIFDLHKTTHFN